jgi:hypothetical protein
VLGAFKKVKSIIATHVWNEAYLFVPPYVQDISTFDELLGYFLPDPDNPAQQTARRDIKARYWDSSNAFLSAQNMIQDALFTCNIRWLFDGMTSVNSTVYLADYQVWKSKSFAVHALDLFPLFWNADTKNLNVRIDINVLFKFAKIPTPPKSVKILVEDISTLHSSYQAYFAEHAISGSPNHSPNTSLTWLTAKDVEGTLSNVLGVYEPSSGTPYILEADISDPTVNCSFWLAIAKSISSSTPSAAPKALVVQNDYQQSDMEF